ncbi:hypothetical protein LZ31DRAFT_192147 [Colletotrichum somersetense]|nr:hypothetical protein LZ31DRAFT_192147 [Colletotrichum somersetense]
MEHTQWQVATARTNQALPKKNRICEDTPSILHAADQSRGLRTRREEPLPIGVGPGRGSVNLGCTAGVSRRPPRSRTARLLRTATGDSSPPIIVASLSDAPIGSRAGAAIWVPVEGNGRGEYVRIACRGVAGVADGLRLDGTGMGMSRAGEWAGASRREAGRGEVR